MKAITVLHNMQQMYVEKGFSKREYAYNFMKANLLAYINGERSIFDRQGSYSSRIRFRVAYKTTRVDYLYQFVRIFDYCNIRYELGNDNPRGLWIGGYVKILTKITK